MLKPCQSLKIRNECIVTDNSKLSVNDLLRMLLNGEMGNGEGGMVYGKWEISNFIFPFPIPRLSNIPSFTNRKTKKSVKYFSNEL